MSRTIIQVVVAVVSALFTTISLYPDLNQFVTGDWPWAPLVSFLVFVCIVVWMLIDKQLQISRQPKLELGNPRQYQNQRLERIKIFTNSTQPAGKYEIVMYRVPVNNRGGDSSGVAVRLIKTEPEIPGGMPVMTLHHMGDNPGDKVSYEKTFPMGHEDEAWVDVIAVTKDSPHQKCFIYSIGSPDSVLEIQLSGQYIFTLRAISEKSSPPTKYQVDVDLLNGQLSMIKL